VLSADIVLAMEVRPAVLLVDASLAADSNAAIAVAAASELAGSVFQVTPLVAVDSLWPEFKAARDCGPDLVESEKVQLKQSLAAGRRAFFQEMDTGKAAEILEPGLNRYFAMPCLAYSDAALKTELCRAGVLFARLQLLLGKPEAASAHTVVLAEHCLRDDLMREDVPPDVRSLSEKVIAEVEARRLASRNDIDIICTGTCLNIFVDGRLLEAGSTQDSDVSSSSSVRPVQRREGMSVKVLPGHHVVEVRVSETEWMSAEFDYDGGHRTLFLDPQSLVGLTAGGGMVAGGPIEAVATELESISGLAVLGIVPGPAQSKRWQLVVLRDPAGVMTGRVLAVLGAEGESIRFTTVTGSPLMFAPKKAWPWPWVTGSFAAAFLTAGITLNVYANKAWQDAEAGTITRDRGDALNSGAIAGYVLAGAGTLATVLLAVLRPSQDQSVLVEPTSSGFRLKF
jgi:hypothetical protein